MFSWMKLGGEGCDVVTVSHVLTPLSKACLIIGRAWSSVTVQSSELPNDIAPKITLDTLRPDLPSLGCNLISNCLSTGESCISYCV